MNVPTFDKSQARMRHVRSCRRLMLAGWLTCLVTTLLVPCTNAEVTPFAGPIILLLGLGLIGCGVKARAWQVAGLGAAQCMVCVLFVGLVNLFHWDPKQCAGPLLALGFAWVVLAGLFTYKLWRRLPLYEIWQCQQCGYPLFGLSQGRCPECGEAFRPAQLADPRLVRIHPRTDHVDSNPPL
jgi:hypothetical protein